MNNFADIHALIIEDDQTSVAVLQGLLNLSGVSSDVILDSHEINAHLQDARRPDVIFLDLEMRASNGYEIFEMIQSIEVFDGVPVVAYTTHISHMNEVRQAGF